MASFSLLLWGTSSAQLIGNWLMIHPGQARPGLSLAQWWVKAVTLWWLFSVVWYVSVRFSENRDTFWVYGKHVSVSEIAKDKYSSSVSHASLNSKDLNSGGLNPSFPPCPGWSRWVNPCQGRQRTQAALENLPPGLLKSLSEAYSKPTHNQLDNTKPKGQRRGKCCMHHNI